MRVRIFILTNLAFSLLTFVGCEKNEKEKVFSNTSNEVTQESWSKVELQYAKNFSVSYENGYKLITLKHVQKGSDLDFQQKLVLYSKNDAPPELTSHLKDAWLIPIPIQRVAANEDGEITRLKNLGLTDRIVGMGGGDIYDGKLRNKWENGEIASIGYSFHSIPEPELLMSSGAELLVLHTYDNSRLDGMKKLRELGINAIPQFAWSEPHFLAKAEWIKFTSLFFNKEKEANELFDTIASRCELLTRQVADLQDKATSFLLYHPSNQGDWKAHRNDFYSSYLKAVSTNILQDNGPTHSVGITNEQLLNLAKDADFWLVNSIDDSKWPPSAFLNSFKSYREGNVYHYQKRTNYQHNAYDWYETPEVRPDLVLEDLISIFYPELIPDHELVFFEKVKLTKK